MHRTGYLYAEEYLDGEGTGNYQRRWFEFTPLQGLQWFVAEPAPASQHKQTRHHEKGEKDANGLYLLPHPRRPGTGTAAAAADGGGWVYGGTVRVTGVKAEQAAQQQLSHGGVGACTVCVCTVCTVCPVCPVCLVCTVCTLFTGCALSVSCVLVLVSSAHRGCDNCAIHAIY